MRQALADYLNKNPTLSKCLLFLFGILTLLALEGALRLSSFGSRFDFILKDKNERDLFLKETNSNGVMTRPIWTLMNKLDMFSDCQSSEINNAIWLEERVVNIPSSVRIF